MNSRTGFVLVPRKRSRASTLRPWPICKLRLSSNRTIPKVGINSDCCSVRLRIFGERVRVIRRSLQIKPNFAPAHYNLALTLIANPQSKLDWPQAIAECREALKYQPDYAEARNLLGAGLTSEGEIEAAIIELQHAVRLNPSLAEARFNLAIALEKNDRLDEAAQEFQAAITAKASYPEATTSLGKLYLRMGKMQEAEKELEKAVQLNPDLADAHHALAGVFQSQDKRGQATVELNLATDLSRRTTDAIESARLSNLGLQLASKGDLAGANAALRQAIALKPDYGIPHYNLGLILADQKNFSDALQELMKAISLLPGQAKPWLQAGRVLLARGDPRARWKLLRGRHVYRRRTLRLVRKSHPCRVPNLCRPPCRNPPSRPRHRQWVRCPTLRRATSPSPTSSFIPATTWAQLASCFGSLLSNPLTWLPVGSSGTLTRSWMIKSTPFLSIQNTGGCPG